MLKNKLNSEQRFIRNLLIGFFSALFIVFVSAMLALFQTLTTYPSAPENYQALRFKAVMTEILAQRPMEKRSDLLVLILLS